MTNLIQLEVADYSIGLRGKLMRAEKLGDGKRPAFCTIVYGLDAADDVADTPLSSAANGYPDALVEVDESTRVVLPWRRDTSAVLGSLVAGDGAPLAEDPRNIVAVLTSRLAEFDVTPVLGFEYEVHVFQRPTGPVRSLDDLVPFSRLHNAYSLARGAAADDLAAEFVHRMDAIGITVEAFHSELGHGFFEFALGPLPAPQAADAAARAKQYFKDLAAERGLLASFMAKPRVDASGAGGHVHLSVARDGVNVFCEEPGLLSDTGRAYLAGLLASMPDLTLLMCPNPNSYRRLSAEHFVAERAGWGWDNRNAACRVIAAGPTAQGRVEHRRPGADASPYLVAAALLAGGLHGLRDTPELPTALAPDGGNAGGGGRVLPNTLRDAITALDSSAVARELVGKDFVEAYLASRRAELGQYEAWLAAHVSSWEIDRYLEAL